MNDTPRTPSLGDVLDLARQLAHDEDTSGPSLRHRDREVGRDLAHLEDQPLRQALGWLQRVRTPDDEQRVGRVNALHRLGLTTLTAAGLAAGWGGANVVFFYDGTHPVNIIHVLAVFALAPLVLLLGFGVGLLPARIVRRVPGLGAVQDGLSLLSPGRVQHLLARRLPQSFRDTLAGWLGRGQAHQRLFGRVDRWLMTHSSQVFALSFHVGALAAAVYLVVFSDLAFAWSTTLQQTPADLLRWTDTLSAPWAWAWSDARPSAALIEHTRYFRLGDGSFPDAPSPVGLGGWWPFLVMSMAVYGILPRLLTLLLARWRLHTALRHAMLHLPGLDEVRMRLNWALVETQAEEPDDDGSLEPGEPTPTVGATSGGVEAVALVWAGAVTGREAGAERLRTTLGATVSSWHEAGGASTTTDDAAVLTALADAPGVILVLVKAWEPPMAELHDFLRDLRASAGQGRSVHVLPLGPDGADAEARHVDTWRRALTTLGDPWLRVIDPESEAP